MVNPSSCQKKRVRRLHQTQPERKSSTLGLQGKPDEVILQNKQLCVVSKNRCRAQQITACVRHIKPAVIREGRHASCEKQTTCLGSTQLCFHAGKKPTPNALKNPGIPANVKPCSISFEHFSLGHVLCATVTCPFSTSQTSKRGPRTSVFNAFHLKTCFTCTLHSACAFSRSQLPKVV